MTFEQYLEKLCFLINPAVLDDEQPDFFNNWIGNMPQERMIDYANMYGQEKLMEGFEKAKKIVDETFENK